MTGQENSSGLWWRWELLEADAGSLLRLFQSLYLQGETPPPIKFRPLRMRHWLDGVAKP